MDVKKALKELADEIKAEIIERIHSRVGINPRTGENTLAGSSLETSIAVKPTSENALAFEIADYYEYVVNGWRRTHRFPNTSKLFLKNIMDWIARKNVRSKGLFGNMSQNQIAYYLYRRMIIEGREIAPRPFIESGYNNNEDPSKILPFLDDFFSNWADKVFELITKDLDKYFS